MNDVAARLWSVLDRHSLLILLVSLVLMLTIGPAFGGAPMGRVVMYAFFSVVYLAALAANGQRRGVLVAGIIIGLPGIVLMWLTLEFDTARVFVTGHLLAIAFFLMTALLILAAVLRQHMATTRAIHGAICVYLLLGFAWALAYSAIERVERQPLVFHVGQRTSGDPDAPHATALAQLIYFSFVTLTTLGYGDISPRTASAQALAWTEAVTGQFYLAVLVARLVSVLPRFRGDE